jgi:adenosine/AMP kinase
MFDMMVFIFRKELIIMNELFYAWNVLSYVKAGMDLIQVLQGRKNPIQVISETLINEGCKCDLYYAYKED